MKKVILLWAAIAITFASFAKPSNNPESTQKWTVQKSDNQVEGNETRDVWSINYLESQRSVKVVKYAVKKGFEYAVHSDFFDVCYENSKNKFGVKYLKRSLCKVDDQLTQRVIDNTKMGRQKILLNKQTDDQTAVELIATYLPELLGENYKFLLQ